MRTTVTIDDDVAAEIDRLRRAEGIGLSEALNRLVREGIGRPQRAKPYRHRTARLGLKVDVTNIAEVLDVLDDDRAGSDDR